MKYVRGRHSAVRTDSYVFGQLIPYIGNKRKLLTLIGDALRRTRISPAEGTFVDLFAGSGVVSRYAKQLGFRVLSNDWEPYAHSIGRCFIEANRAPRFSWNGSYRRVLDELNSLEPIEGWITRHLCPPDDQHYDVGRDRLFFMRKNGMRIDAIRERIVEWECNGRLGSLEKHCLLAPLLYAACYASNTSGVFKGFHNGWGGQTGTALYRIAGDLRLTAPAFHDNGRRNEVFAEDAAGLAARTPFGETDVVYLDPPYNQHPYGSNYHVLNTIVLWDQPRVSPRITGHGDKSAIRTDWRTLRRSAYNSARHAASEYARLVETISARWILTSYSTDGNIDLPAMAQANAARGQTQVVLKGYKRYRVSSTRPSAKPMNVEFVLLTDTRRRATTGADEIVDSIMDAERAVLADRNAAARLRE